MDVEQRRVEVRRITVDERLAAGLIRLAVCRLKKGVEVFYDREGDWGPERAWLARPENYARKLGVPKAEAPAWDSLQEGQLYLSGEFEIVGERSSPSYFCVSPGAKEFVRIDALEEYRRGLQRVYSVLLKGGE